MHVEQLEAGCRIPDLFDHTFGIGSVEDLVDFSSKVVVDVGCEFDSFDGGGQFQARNASVVRCACRIDGYDVALGE